MSGAKDYAVMAVRLAKSKEPGDACPTTAVPQ